MFNLDISFDKETKEKLKKKIEHKIKRCNSKIDNLKSKESLSQYGYWDLGYFEGRKALLEDLLDELNKDDKEKQTQEIVYFELNNWFADRDYPATEPFISWLRDDFKIRFNNEDWIIANKLCVVKDFIDMSQNFCITATREWVEQNCPTLLTEHTKFLRIPNQDGEVYGRFGHLFLEYDKQNFGITNMDLGL